MKTGNPLAVTLRHALEKSRAEAAERWNAFDTARAELVEAGKSRDVDALRQLDDLHRSYEVSEWLDRQLRLAVLVAEDQHVLTGSGVSPNLRGILNTTGILTVERNTAGSESQADAIHRAITAIRIANLEPTAVVLHPNDWQTIRLSKNPEGDYPDHRERPGGQDRQPSRPRARGRDPAENRLAA